MCMDHQARVKFKEESGDPSMICGRHFAKSTARSHGRRATLSRKMAERSPLARTLRERRQRGGHRRHRPRTNGSFRLAPPPVPRGGSSRWQRWTLKTTADGGTEWCWCIAAFRRPGFQRTHRLARSVLARMKAYIEPEGP